MKILVVDDSTFARGILIRELKANGIAESEISQSDTGAGALESMAAQAFDLALLDIVMTGIDGIAVLKAFKEAQPKAKVIMCSSHSSPEALEELKALGSDAFLLKPFSAQEFKDIVGPFLEK